MAALDQKVIVITGAAGGMGAADAELCVQEGASVVTTDIRDDEGGRAARELGPDVLFVHHDVSRPDDWDRVVRATIDRFGRIDGLVNNAGIMKGQLLLDTSFDDYLEVIRINQNSVFLGLRSVAPVMAAAGGGSIVNISSIAGLNGSIGTFSYTAAKWAVRGMTKAAAQEFASSNIRVNSVHPGTVDTPMVRGFTEDGPQGGIDRLAANVPLGHRLARPSEIAEMVAFLLSDKSAFCTGSEFVVDGGKSSRLVQ